MKKILQLAIFIIVIIIPVGSIIIHNNNIKNEREIIDEKQEIIKEISFEIELYEYIKSLNIAHPEIVLAQAKIESGNFKSSLFLQHNNLFGMKLPRKRATVATGKTPSGFAKYKSWQYSVIDYALYQTYSAKNLTEEDYIKFLNRNYAEDPIYNIKLKKLIQE